MFDPFRQASEEIELLLEDIAHLALRLAFAIRRRPQARDLRDRLVSGDKSRDPSIEVRAFRQRWGATIYHTPADDMAQSFNWTSAALFTRIQFLIGYIVGNSTARPSWIGNQPIVQ